MSIIEDLNKGKDLFVVLKNRNGRGYTESYNLNTVVIKDKMFLGKFLPVHSPVGHSALGIRSPLSYTYNNFSDIVCTSSQSERMERFVSSNIYSEMKFGTKGKYAVIIENGDVLDHDLLDNIVNSCGRLKVKIKSTEGLIYICDVHTIELYDDRKSIGLDTTFEALPESLFDFEYIYSLGEQLSSVVFGGDAKVGLGTEYKFDVDFRYLSFLISNRSVCQVVDGRQSSFEYKNLEIDNYSVFCECC